ncbi:MAG: sterol desaturase family protein [Bacteroidetes bacterium]|nr:sterol desaturase family protein [Bacteroidota bacterium]
MFKSDFLEIFSKMHPATPLIIFVPVILFFMYQTLFILKLNWGYALLFIIGGLFVWTITEYILHRFLFHYKPSSKIGQRIHFIFHGVHHDYPNDAKRLVMAPAVSVPLAILFYYLFKALVGEAYVAPFFTGFVIGYLIYDMTHYAIHHFQFKNAFWQQIKKHHMVHHYVDDDNGYGVSSKFWDIIFRTDFKQPNNK